MVARGHRAWLTRTTCLSLAALCSTAATAGTVRLIERADLGITVIHFEGQIVKGDLKRIQAHVPKARNANPNNQVYISFHSGGGHLWEGTDIGNYVRNQGFGTILLPGAACASACSVAFWGGFDGQAQKPRRIVMSGARIGVHRAHIPADRLPKGSVIDANAVLELVQKRIASVVEYLNDMDVSPEVQRRTFATASNEIYVLTEDDLDGSKVVRLERSGGAWTPPNELAAAIQLPSGAVSRLTKVDPAPQPAQSALAHTTTITAAWHECMYGSTEGRKTDERKIEGCSRVVQGPRSAYTSEQIVNAYRTRGQAYSRMGRYDLAVADHTNAYALDISNPAHLVDRGDAYFRSGNHALGIADFDTAIQNSPHFARAYASRGVAHEARGSWKLALADFETALRLQPSDEVASSGRRRVESKVAAPSTAPRHVETARLQETAAPTRAAHHLDQLRADCTQEGDPDRTINACTQILAAKQQHENHHWLVSAYTSRGDAYMAKGWYTPALYDYSSGLGLSRSNAYSWAKRAEANLALSRYNEAVSDYSSAISLNPTARLYSQRGAAFVKARAYDKALSDFDKAIDLSPTLAIAYAGRGDAHAGKGEHGKALADYERALTLDTSLAQAQEARHRIIAIVSQAAPSQPRTSSGTQSETAIRREADRCDADSATFSRDDGALFSIDRFGKFPPFVRIFAGDLRGRRTYLVEQPDASGALARVSLFEEEFKLGKIDWQPKGQAPTADALSDQRVAFGPLIGTWRLAGCGQATAETAVSRPEFLKN